MTGMSFIWTLAGHGWADFTVADDQAGAEATASYITAAPEELLTAVARLIAGEKETRAQFEAEPTAYLTGLLAWSLADGTLLPPSGEQHDSEEAGGHERR